MTDVLPLDGLRVVDLSTWVAGAYGTKLLSDGGAEVTKVEPVGGDPLRDWSASGAPIPDGGNGGLYNFLAAGKHSVTVDADSAEQTAALHEMFGSADVVVWSRGGVAGHPGLSPAALRRSHPHLTVTAITPFGLDGPWADRPATEFTLQAWSGAMIGLGRGWVDRAPTYVGGQIGEWLTGVYAAVGTLASWRRGGRELVDVSMLETLALCLTYYPVTFTDQMGRPMRKKRFVPSPGVAAAKDGLVGLGVGTGQQWYDFCAMVGHPEWTEDPKLLLERSALAPTIDAWIAGHSVEELLELATAFRIPNAPIVNGANAESFKHFQDRGNFVTNPMDGATNPSSPYRLTVVDSQPDEPREPASGSPEGLPFSGLRVLDMTAYWAGPLVGHILAMLGAEVVHLESPKRPDGVRLVGGVPQTEDRYWERGPIFAALNTNKKSLTIDLGDERGLQLLRRFVATCDVVVENFTPRVLDQLGLSFASLLDSRPDLVMVRMPGFGLDGPWRDSAAFAFVIEDASGLTWLSGPPDKLPIEPYCVGDPNAGLHALVGMQIALAHRDRTGQGVLVEAAMVDAALNIAAEQVIEYSAYGTLLERSGNRGPCAAPQNVYQAAGPDDDGRDDAWVAIAVATDEHWSALCRAVGNPEWPTDDRLASAPGRREHHDEIDAWLHQWCRERAADAIVDTLWDAGVPVAKVMAPHRQTELAQLQSRGFFEEVEHPVAPRARYSTLPMTLSRGPERRHRRHAPLLGEHTAELLAELGLGSAEIDQLQADGVIGMALAPVGAHA
ncbi:MAG TPA: CoA transferase [Mycobacteriales bacterium]|nr:CoA transferase [Mycobacteriales bacterium]